MLHKPSSPPYFEHLLARLAEGDERTVQAFGRHVHWGYWDDPAGTDVSAADYGHAAATLCRVVLELAYVADGHTLADVGCGFGGTIAALDAEYRALRMIGVNIDDRQLRRAREFANESGRSAIAFVQADAARLPLATACFDTVLAVECVFHFDRPRFFAEARRVLKPSGALVLSDFVPIERAAEFMGDLSGAAGEAIRWTYGDVDLSWPLSRYRELAAENNLRLVSERDITVHTLPTYEFLKASVADWPSPRDVELFLTATGLLEKASRRGLMTYQVLRFQAE